MPQTAQAQAPRLIELIAWLSQSDSPKTITYKAAAKQLGVSEKMLREDLEVLLELTAEHKDWLASLRVALVAEEFTVLSRGAFLRPIHLTEEEGLALLLGLTGVRGGSAVAAKFTNHGRGKRSPESVESAFAIGAAPSAELDGLLAVARRARDEKRKLEILYCGSAGEPSRRTIHVHQIVEHAGRWYVIAWCETCCDMRHFRADRLLEARLLVQDFRPQVLFRPIGNPQELLQTDETVTAQVAFSKKIARWLEEKYPNGRTSPDGRYVVKFQVADPAWFVREILQYGAQAEVLSPDSFREAVRKMVSVGEVN
ncbi:MAG: WYL domain-containing protein [Deltaproteobacteria bacterium]|nr:WYL domain-containing protein [Deltaproteobacteria bacterium]